MAKPKRKWPRIVAMILVGTVLIGGVSLVLVDKFAPDQTYIPQSIVQIPGEVVSGIIRPMQGIFAWMSNGVNGYLRNLKLQKTIEIEYNELKKQNDQLIYDSLYVKELEEENQRLKDQLKVFQAYEEQNPVMATVTKKETGNWFQMFTIDRGERHGIKINMAVINVDGLIGYVYKVYETTAEVISIIDSRAAISGIIQSSRDQGIVRGTLGADDEATCRMYYLPVDQIARPGDTVVTSGIGLPFPKGIRIGEVRESTRYMDENKHFVVIEPYVDFQHIEEVIVLVYEPSAEEMPEDNDGQVLYEPMPLDTVRPVPPLGEQFEDPNLGAVTPPPRATRMPSEGSGMEEAEGASASEFEQYAGDPTYTLAPGATPTPNPELDALMREEMEADD